jgi:hypothetical protein
MRAIEATGILTAEGQIRLDHPLPQAKPSRVRVILLMPEDDLLDEQTWLSAIARNPSFAFLNDPEEDIYTLEDGQDASHFCSPHPKSLSQGGRGTLNLVLPFSHFGRRGWGMRATLQNWDALDGHPVSNEG